MEVLKKETAERTMKEQFLENLEKVDFTFDTAAAKKVREEALHALNSVDFPTSKTEYWKYTRLGPILKEPYAVKESESHINISEYGYADSYRLVFVNGFFRRDLSDQYELEGIKIYSLAEAKEKFPEKLDLFFGKNTGNSSEIFTAINGAFHNDGAFISVEKNKKIEMPIHIVHLIDGQGILSQPRNLIVAEEGSEMKLIESFESNNGKNNLINSLSEIVVAENAKLEFNKLQDLNEDNSQICTEFVKQLSDSAFTINTISLSGKMLRNNLNISVEGTGCESHLNGLYLSKGNQYVDNHTIIDHKESNCESHELYKGILNDRSTGVFNGRVLVRQAAQKTNAFQSNANILLTDDATINSKPELEIYADDVKCSHGSTTGQIDQEALFYLKSRGIQEDKARNLLLYAFAGEVLDRATIAPLREKIDRYIAQRYNNSF